MPQKSDYLFILESPVKARRLTHQGVAAMATKGHLFELDDHNDLIGKPDSQKWLTDIVNAARNHPHVILATDLDIDGQAIATHLTDYLAGHGVPVAGYTTYSPTVDQMLREVRVAPVHDDYPWRARAVVDREFVRCTGLGRGEAAILQLTTGNTKFLEEKGSATRQIVMAAHTNLGVVPQDALTALQTLHETGTLSYPRTDAEVRKEGMVHPPIHFLGKLEAEMAVRLMGRNPATLTRDQNIMVTVARRLQGDTTRKTDGWASIHALCEANKRGWLSIKGATEAHARMQKAGWIAEDFTPQGRYVFEKATRKFPELLQDNFYGECASVIRDAAFDGRTALKRAENLMSR